MFEKLRKKEKGFSFFDRCKRRENMEAIAFSLRRMVCTVFKGALDHSQSVGRKFSPLPEDLVRLSYVLGSLLGIVLDVLCGCLASLKCALNRELHEFVLLCKILVALELVQDTKVLLPACCIIIHSEWDGGEVSNTLPVTQA
jgi:hypothetical protein